MSTHVPLVGGPRAVSLLLAIVAVFATALMLNQLNAQEPRSPDQPANEPVAPNDDPAPQDDDATTTRSLDGAIESINLDDVTAHEKMLTSDDFEGREAGSNGGRKASAYIVSQLKAFGLEPKGVDGTWFQPFSAGGAVTLGEDNRLSYVRADGHDETRFSYKVERDYNLFSFSKNKSIEGAPVVFVGFGITAPELNYDDYAGVDVKGAVVLMMRHEPQADDASSEWNGREYTTHAQFVMKAANAERHGAVAMILVNRPSAATDNLITFEQAMGGGSYDLAAAHVRKRVADSILGGDGKLAELEDAINEAGKPASYVLEGVALDLTSSLNVQQPRNILAWLEGSDEELKHEHVIIGAHYDHLGYGNFGALDRSNEIHRGADDNASGTTAVLEVAQAFAAFGVRPKRSILFMWFDAEEKGLFGSQHYCQNPILPLKDCVGMVNLDMVGRIREDGLDLGGTQSSPGWGELLDKACEGSDLTFTRSRGVAGNSDHASFYRVEIPVVFLFSGLHPEYHTAKDTIDTINLPGIVGAAQIAYRTVDLLANRDGRLEYRRVATGRNRVILGIVPDMTGSLPGDLEGGVKVASLTPGGPAGAAGMQEGDVIVKMGTQEIRTLDDLVGVLQEHQPGDKVLVEVWRDGEIVTLQVELGGRR